MDYFDTDAAKAISLRAGLASILRSYTGNLVLAKVQGGINYWLPMDDPKVPMSKMDYALRQNGVHQRLKPPPTPPLITVSIIR